MRMMKAMVLEEPKKFVYKDVPVPTISSDEVLIKVKYCGICGSDWGSYNGKYEEEVACLPLITGHEFWGIIEETGENVNVCQTRRPGGGRYLPALRHLLLLPAWRASAVQFIQADRHPY